MEHTAVTTDSTFYVGQVKWFNSKSGYGFITIKNECDKQGNDIFVHYTNILTESQYKYLIQGEYVQFKLLTSVNESHEFQASEISDAWNSCDSLTDVNSLNCTYSPWIRYLYCDSVKILV